ncbi:MAG TPA: alpha/beta hydrolase [Bacillota bacterium]|nr:alpha/beta hydrolase [Bacillota bacterium]
MASVQAKIFNLMLKSRRKPVFDLHTSIPKFRQDCEEGARRFGKFPAGVEVIPVSIDNMYAEWLMPAHNQKQRIILYIHGGGYVSGSCSDHRAIVANRIAKDCEAATLLFEYRLAPEYPYPAALDDSVKAYRWLLAQNIAPSNIIIVGESAGGGLCLATLIALRDQELPLPAAAVAISPWTDLKCTGASYRTKNKVSVAPLNSWNVFSRHYVGDSDPGLPWVSPLYGDLRGLPPLFIVAGEADELVDDSIRFAEKAKAAGVDVTLRVGESMIHCYPLLPPFIPEARQAMKEICTFIKEHF